MTTIAASRIKRLPWHTIVFTILAGLFALVIVADAAPGLLRPWVLSRPAPGFTPELHRWHSVQWGILTGLLFCGSLLLVLWRPRSKPLLMQFATLAGILLFGVGMSLRNPSAFVLMALFLLIVALYPAPRALLDVSRPQPVSRPLLALSLLAAVLLAPIAWDNVRWQLTGVGGEHATYKHWAFGAVMDVVLVLAGLLAATKRPGWRTLGTLAGVAFCYLGVAAMTIPYQDGSWGTAGGILSLFGGIAFLTATVLEARTRRPIGRNLPPWLPYLPAAVALAALLTMAIMWPGGAGGSSQAPGGPVALIARDFTFAPAEIHTKAGASVSLRLDNRDAYPHQFDLDAFNVHVPMPAGQSSVARFMPRRAGTYTFYCVLHANKATGQGMVGKLVVTP